MDYSEKDIAELQKKLEKQYIDEPTALDNLIEGMASHIGRTLTFKADQTFKTEFQDRVFTFKYRKYVSNFKSMITMFVIDEETKSEAEKRHVPYKPYIVNAEITNSMDLSDNLKNVVEAFLRHYTGTIKAEVLEEDDQERE